MTIFAVGLACSFGAGALLEAYGWVRLNLMLLPWMAIAVSTLMWFTMRSPRQQKEALS